MDNAKKKRIKRYITWVLLACLVLLLTVMPLLAKAEAEADGPVASILSETVQTGEVSTALHGGGTLAANGAEDVIIPTGVKITEFLVHNGDTVTTGTPLALVDKVSVMTAITGVSETMEYLQEEMENARDEKVSGTISATAGGRVKKIFAQEGEQVQEVMLRDGALAVLSLDGLMAVKMERSMDIRTGEAVQVTLSDGTEVTGRVESNLDGVIIVTVDDKGYAIGEPVTVTAGSGEQVGAGQLYIHNAWKATAFSGTISKIHATEERTVNSGAKLFTLKDTEFTGQLEYLASQHREYEELMQDLFRMYESGTIDAPCDGMISGIEKDSAHLLAAEGQWKITLLNDAPAQEAGFAAFAAKLTDITESGLQLKIDPNLIRLSSLYALSEITLDPDAMTRNLTYGEDAQIYAQSADGTLKPGTANAGDTLLFVGDESGVLWIVNTDASAEAVSHDGSVQLQLLSSVSCTGMPGCEAETHNDNCPEKCIMLPGCIAGKHTTGCPEICTLAANCTASKHDANCLSRCDKTANCPAAKHVAECIKNCTKTQACKALNHYNDCPKAEYTVYTGFVGRVTQIADKAVYLVLNQVPAEVTQTKGGIWNFGTLDLNNPMGMVPMEDPYPVVDASIYSVGDTVVVVYDELGNLYDVVKPQTGFPELPGFGDLGGLGGLGGFGNLFDMIGGFGGFGNYNFGATPETGPELYDLEGSVLMTVTPQETMTLTIMLDEQDIARVSLGEKATVKVEALRGETFEATVTKISLSGSNMGGSSKFRVELTLDMVANMIPGMSATAVLPLDTRENVLIVPVAAVAESGWQTVVYTALDEETGDPTNPVVVETGLSDGEYVEILSGLSEGDTIYYSYYDTLELNTSAEAERFTLG